MVSEGASAAATVSAAPEVLFEVTPRIQRAVARVLDATPAVGTAAEREHLRAYRGAASEFDSAAIPIPISHVAVLSRLVRPLADPTADGHSGWVHELTEGSAVVSEAPKAKRKSPEFEAFLARMRVKAEKREYEGMVRNIRPKATVFDTLSGGVVDADPSAAAAPRRNPTSSGKGVSADAIASNPFREAAVGMNVIVVMVTGFVVFWYAGRQYFISDLNPHTIKPVLCGVVGLILALLLEVTLLIVRDQKHQLRERLRFQAANPGVVHTRPAGGDVAIMSGATLTATATSAATATASDDTSGAVTAAATAANAAGGGDADGEGSEMAALKHRKQALAKHPPAPPASFQPLSFGGGSSASGKAQRKKAN